MGQLLKAICKNCEFECTRFPFGSNRDNFDTVWNVPAIDLNSNKFIIANYYNKEKLKDSVLFYTERELFNGDITAKNNSHNWCGALIKTTENKCPVCKDFTMNFEEAGHFS